MLTRFRIPLVAIVAILLLASCKKTNKQGKYAPNDAAVVLHIDGASVSSKLPWSELKQNALFQQAYGDTSLPAFVKNALDNPDNSGVDTKADMLFFVQKDTIGGVVAFTGAIKDAEKFKLFCMDASGGGSQSEKDGVNFISKSPMVIGWNKEKFLFVVNAPEMGYSKYTGGSGLMNEKPRDLLATCTNLFNLKEDNSLGENEKFTELVKTSGDIHFWVNAAQLNQNMLSNNPALSMVKLNSLYEGSFTAATLNFENGRILIDVKSYAGKEMSELYKKYEGKNIDEDMIKRLPIKDVAAIFSMSFKPEGIKEFLKLLGVEAYANMGLAFAGFSLDDFIKANKGDLLIAFGDFKTKKDSAINMAKDSIPVGIPTINTKPDVIFATSVGDKDAFNQLIKAGEKFGKNVPADFPISYNTDGKYFAIGNSKDDIDKYFANKSNNSYDFLSKMNGKPFGGYVNFQYIMKTFENDIPKDSSAKVVFDASLKTWDNAFMSGGNYDDGGLTQHIEINLLDKNTNSLKQLNQYLGITGKVMIEKKKEEERRAKKEETDVIYPPLSSLGDSTKTNK